MHNIPESNLLNPAVRTPCKWYIGLPVLSSTHLSYANNMFSYNELFSSGNSADIDKVVNQLHWRNYLGTEFHTQLLAIGYNQPNFSIVFTATEKNNLPITLPKSAIEFAWYGNTPSEGSTASLKGAGVYFNHYREYALSTSKPLFSGGHIGIRAKLLFGKLNVSTQSTDISITTDENTFDLEFEGDLLVRSSLPIEAEVTDNVLTRLALADDLNLQELITNSKNPGFAIDLGIVFPYSDRIEISASIIDLGFIRWRSNLNTFRGEGKFVYQGVPTNTIPTDDYLADLLDELMESYSLEVEPEKYTTFLPTTLMAGANYLVSNKLEIGITGRAQIFRSKLIPSMTIQGQYNPFDFIGAMLSYTVQHYDYKQVGVGIVVGRSPIQFYTVSDNILGTIWPLSARSVNLRFGFNILLGCDKNSKINGSKSKSGNCYGMNRAKKKPYMKKLSRGSFDRKY